MPGAVIIIAPGMAAGAVAAFFGVAAVGIELEHAHIITGDG